METHQPEVRSIGLDEYDVRNMGADYWDEGRLGLINQLM